ncbi:hypothetical protein ACFC06_00680 [Nocardia sp. NPDC056064]
MNRRDRRRAQRLLVLSIIAATALTAGAPAVVALEHHGWNTWTAPPPDDD